MKVDFKARTFDLGGWHIDNALRNIMSVGKVIGFTFIDTLIVLVFDRVTFCEYNIITDRLVGICFYNPSGCRNGKGVRRVIEEHGFRIDRSLVIQDDAIQQLPAHYVGLYGRVYPRRADAVKDIIYFKGKNPLSCIRVTQQEVEIEGDDHLMTYKIQKR